MIDVLLIGQKNATLSELSGILNRQNDVTIAEVGSREEAVKSLSDNQYQLIIVDETVKDETGIEFTKRLISENPLLNCALVGSLSKKDFHEATEGLGVLAQIPKHPEVEDIEKLLTSLRRILGLLG